MSEVLYSRPMIQN